jgi:hypothetical protein
VSKHAADRPSLKAANVPSSAAINSIIELLSEYDDETFSYSSACVEFSAWHRSGQASVCGVTGVRSHPSIQSKEEEALVQAGVRRHECMQLTL